MIETIGVEQTVRRGEIHWVEKAQSTYGAELRKSRPAIIVSSNKQNNSSDTVQVVYLTSQPKKEMPTHVVLGETSNGKGAGSTVLCENIYSISKDRLSDDSYFARVSDEDMDAIDWALITSLALDGYFDEDATSEPEEHIPDTTEMDKVRLEAEFYKSKYNDLLERIMSKAEI